jgi:MFS family permease
MTDEMVPAQSAPPAPSAPSYRALFAIPAIGRMMLGMVIARTASQMASVVLVLFTLTHFGSPELAGLVTFASLAPGLLVAPLVGALLDRHGRTRLVMLDYLAAAAACTAIGVLAATDLLTAPLLIVIALVLGFSWPLGTVGLRSLVPLIVPRDLWGRANAIDSNGYVIATLIGPPVAGAMVALAGGALALIVVGATYLVATVVLVGMPDPRTPTESTGRLRRDAMDGVRYVLHHRTLRGLGLGLSIWNVGGGILQILVPVLLITELGQGPAVVGLAWAVSGIGGLIAALVFGRIDSPGRERRMILVPLLVTAAAMSLLLLPLEVWLVVLVLLLVGLSNGPMDVGMFSIRQRRTDPSWVGRAFAVSMTLNFTGFPIGSALGGLLVGKSVDLTIAVAALSALVAAVIIWRLVPSRGGHDLAPSRSERALTAINQP